MTPVEKTPEDCAADRTAVLDRLYAAAPSDFVQVRSELVTAARADGDSSGAKRIAALRKPTSAAAVVNRQVLTDPSVLDRLRDIGDRLRAAQSSRDGIDRDALRELSTERRTLVQQISAGALDAFAPTAGSAVSDEVIATFDAAVADPGIATRLGRLVHAEQWSGFGVAADDANLTLVQGGRSGTRQRAATGEDGPDTTTAPPARNRATTRSAEARRERELSAADSALAAAEHELSTASDRDRAARDRCAELEKHVTDLQKQLDAALHDARAARSAVRTARSRQREARSARDRVARRVER